MVWSRVGALGLVLLVGCTSTTIQSVPSAGGTVAGIGDTVRLHGSDEELVMAVTLTRVEDPAKPPRFFGPAKGKHYVAVELRLANVGTIPFADSPGNGAALIDDGEHEYSATIAGLDQELGSPKIAVSDTRVGLIVFEVPDGTRPAMFQLTLDSGFGPETAQWELR